MTEKLWGGSKNLRKEGVLLQLLVTSIQIKKKKKKGVCACALHSKEIMMTVHLSNA